MNCPYCHGPLAEESPHCPACGLNMERLDGVLGVPPVLMAGLNDRRKNLGRGEARRVSAAVAAFQERFPQTRLGVVLGEGPEAVPLGTWAWWLFNRSQFSAALDRGFANRDVLLVVDPARRRAALTVGYGLEPFVSRTDLAAALEAGNVLLQTGQLAEACAAVIECLDLTLRGILERLPRAYGVPPSLLAADPHSAEEAPVDAGMLPGADPWGGTDPGAGRGAVKVRPRQSTAPGTGHPPMAEEAGPGRPPPHHTAAWEADQDRGYSHAHSPDAGAAIRDILPPRPDFTRKPVSGGAC